VNNPPDNIIAGARNLLLGCAGVRSGEQLLLVGEDVDRPWFDPELCATVAQVAHELGANAKIVVAPPGADADEFPAVVADAMQTADVTVFFSRLGDHARFLETPGESRKIMCYTITLPHLGAPFATVDYSRTQTMHDLLVAEFEPGKQYRIEAECGTALSAEIGSPTGTVETDFSSFTLALFPTMIFPPINFYRLQGKLVLQRFLTSTSTREYSDSVLHLASPVSARIEDSRIVGLDGDAGDVDRVEQHLERAAEITGGDPYRINSWHTGINPYTFFEGDPYTDLEYWGSVAFGSPRFTHLHAAGFDPGDICINLFDASIGIDEQPLWEHGRFVYLDRPEMRKLFAGVDCAPDASTIRSIGL